MYSYWKVVATLWLTLFILSCSNEERPEFIVPVSNVPESLVNLGFELSLELDEEISVFEGIPEFSRSLKLSFNVKEVFIRTDLYDDWEYNYGFSVNRIDTNVILLRIFKDSFNAELELNFLDTNGGNWKFLSAPSQDSIKLSGSFYFTPISPPVNHKYEGQVLPKQTISSAITGESYPYRVFLPKSYIQDQSAKYPIIYATDGQWVFWEFSQFLDINQIPAILVAIEQGENNRRAIDYLLPGSHTYIEFFKSEFMPLIEQAYAVDEQRRTIQGASYGGLVVSHFLFDHARSPSFHNYISADGAYWRASESYTDLEVSAGSDIFKTEPANLFLSGATQGGNDSFVELYRRRLEAMSLEGLTIHLDNYDVTHTEVGLPAFRDAVNRIFVND